MKKMTKILLSCAAVATVSAAMATAAFAETTATVTTKGTSTVAGSYEIGTATITINDNPQTDAETTYVVVDKTITGSITNDNKDGVKAIDQVATAAEKTGDKLTIKTNLSTTAPEAGEYEIRVGGTDGTITYYVLKISNDDEPPKSDRKLGNVTDDTEIDLSDALGVAEHVVDISKLTGEKLQAADVNDDAAVDLTDAVEVAQFVVDMDSVVDGTKTVADKKNTVPEDE